MSPAVTSRSAGPSLSLPHAGTAGGCQEGGHGFERPLEGGAEAGHGAGLTGAALGRAQAAADLESSVRLLVEAAVDANSGDPRVHRILYREAPRPPELQARVSALEDVLVDWLAGELTRRDIARGRRSVLRARTLVVAVEALVHELVLDPPAGITRRAATAEVVAVAVAMARA